MGSSYSIEELQEHVYGLKFEVDHFSGTIASRRYSKLQNKLIQTNARILKIKKYSQKAEAQQCDQMLRELTRCLEFLTMKVTQSETTLKEEAPPPIVKEEVPVPVRRKRDPVETLRHYEQQVTIVEEEIEAFLQNHDSKQRLLIEGKLKLLYTDLTIIKIESRTPLDAKRNMLLQRLLRCYKQMKKETKQSNDLQEGDFQRQQSDCDSDFDSDFDSEFGDNYRSEGSGRPSVNSIQDEKSSAGTSLHNFHDDTEVIYENIDVIREYLASKGLSSNNSALVIEDKEHEQRKKERNIAEHTPKHPIPLPISSQESYSNSDLEDEDYVNEKEERIEKKSGKKDDSGDDICDKQEKPTPVLPKPIDEASSLEWSYDSDAYSDESDFYEHLQEYEHNLLKSKQSIGSTLENSPITIGKADKNLDKNLEEQEELHEQTSRINAPIDDASSLKWSYDSDAYSEESDFYEHLQEYEHNLLKSKQSIGSTLENSPITIGKADKNLDKNLEEQEELHEQTSRINAPIVKFPEEETGFSDLESYYEDSSEDERFDLGNRLQLTGSSHIVVTEFENSKTSGEGQSVEFELSSAVKQDSDNNDEYCSGEEEEEDAKYFYETVNPAIPHTENSYREEDKVSQPLSFILEESEETLFPPTIKRKDSDEPCVSDTAERQDENHQKNMNVMFGEDNKESFANQKLLYTTESTNPTKQLQTLQHVLQEAQKISEEVNTFQKVDNDEEYCYSDDASIKLTVIKITPKLLNTLEDREEHETVNTTFSEDDVECLETASNQKEGLKTDQYDAMSEIRKEPFSQGTKKQFRIIKEPKTGLVDYTQEINKIVESVKELNNLKETFKETEDYAVYGVLQEKLMKTIKAMFNINTVNFDKKSLVLYEIVSKDIQMFVNEL